MRRVDALVDLAPAVAAWSRELAQVGVPPMLEHGDLHHWNIFATDGHYTMFDWGDASVSHPFFSLSVVLGYFARDLSIAPTDPQTRPNP